MRRMNAAIGRLACAVSCAGMLVGPVWGQGPGGPQPPVQLPSPPAAGAATNEIAWPQAQDVALDTGGTLSGQVIDQQGMKYAGVSVAILAGTAEVASATTDSQGAFLVRGLRPGLYRVVSYLGDRVVRVWPADAAPPGASRAVVINPVSPPAVGGPRFLRRPIFWWTALGASVAGAYAIGFNAGLDRKPKSE